jgi:hypothetical protein
MSPFAGKQKRFDIKALAGGIPIRLPESFDFNDLSLRVARGVGRIA